jgi:hypothetical protein
MNKCLFKKDDFNFQSFRPVPPAAGRDGTKLGAELIHTGLPHQDAGQPRFAGPVGQIWDFF